MNGIDLVVHGLSLELRGRVIPGWFGPVAQWWSEILRPRWMVCWAALLGLGLLGSRPLGPGPRMRGPWVVLFPVLAVLGATALTHLLKVLLRRPRPPEELALVVEHSFAMPSGHATAAFAAATVLTLLFPGRRLLHSLAWGDAVIMGLLRLYLGVHWLSDVLVGAVLGTGFAWLLWALLRRRRESAETKELDTFC